MPIRTSARLLSHCRPSSRTFNRTVQGVPPRIQTRPQPPSALSSQVFKMSTDSSTAAAAAVGKAVSSNSSNNNNNSPAPTTSTPPLPGNAPSATASAAGGAAPAQARAASGPSSPTPTPRRQTGTAPAGPGTVAEKQAPPALPPLPAPPSTTTTTTTGSTPDNATSSSSSSSSRDPPTQTVHVNGQPIALDSLGPMVVGRDGTISRIANWHEMTAVERENTLRILGKRNQLRLGNLRAGLPADSTSESSSSSSS